MKETTSAHNRPTSRPDEELVLRARHAIERAITNLTVIRSEPDAGDVASGERSAWLLDDLLTVRLQLELLDEDPDLQGGIPHEVCPDCSKPLGTERACAFCVSSALRSQTPEPEMAEGEPADALRQAVDLCSDEIGDDIGMALGRLEDARRAAPDADLQPALDQAIIESHNAITAAFGKLGRELQRRATEPRGAAESRPETPTSAPTVPGRALETLDSVQPQLDRVLVNVSEVAEHLDKCEIEGALSIHWALQMARGELRWAGERSNLNGALEHLETAHDAVVDVLTSMASMGSNHNWEAGDWEDAAQVLRAIWLASEELKGGAR